MMKVPNFTVQEVGDEPVGLNEIQAESLDKIMRSVVQQLCAEDPQHRPRHYGVVVLVLEGQDAAGNDVVTTDFVSSMPRSDLHTILRDWLHRETQ